MAKPISKQALEDAVVAKLVKVGCLQRQMSPSDKWLRMDAEPLMEFIQATQHKE